LKYAADNGYERVGITTGARQAERYDLSNKVQLVRIVTDSKDGEFKDAIFNAVDIDTGRAVNRIINSAAELEDVVGKDLAKKLMEQKPSKGKSGNAGAWVRELSGLDLQVGGEGMKKYYDEVYPKFLDKYGKKWGAKVGETSVNIGTEDKMVSKLRERGYDPETVTLQEILSNSNGRTPSWLTEEDVLMLELGVELTSKGVQKEPIRYVDITPEMRQSVQKGQPLFTAAPIGAGTAGATMQDEEKQ
jgi:hypothetical protein